MCSVCLMENCEILEGKCLFMIKWMGEWVRRWGRMGESWGVDVSWIGLRIIISVLVERRVEMIGFVLRFWIIDF